jgi:type IV secretory system conjugative DNA transfer VirD4/TraG family protein
LHLLFDETANSAPLADLPQQLSEAGSQEIRFATVWQSLGQMRDRYADAADAVLASSTAKVFMGPVTDDATRTTSVARSVARYASGATTPPGGRRLPRRTSTARPGPRAAHQRQPPARRHPGHPSWELRDLKRLGGLASALLAAGRG